MNAKNILLVKTSSLGDLVHALPAVSDIRARFPDAQIDWVVEEHFAGVPRLHPGVRKLIPVAMRRWRRRPWQRDIRNEMKKSLSLLRQTKYDAVIDAQALLKSALISIAAHGRRYGMDFHSSREPLLFFYNRTFRIPWTLHAVERNRLIAARALEYEVPAQCDYGIHAEARRFDWMPEGPYAVLLSATSDKAKLWPEQNWMALGRELNAQGLACVVSWGTALEKARAVRIAEALRAAAVTPVLTLSDLSGLFAGAHAVAGVDTGLTHLSAAFGVPTVGIYSATNPAATGIHGCARALNLGAFRAPPDVVQVLAAMNSLAAA